MSEQWQKVCFFQVFLMVLQTFLCSFLFSRPCHIYIREPHGLLYKNTIRHIDLSQKDNSGWNWKLSRHLLLKQLLLLTSSLPENTSGPGPILGQLQSSFQEERQALMPIYLWLNCIIKTSRGALGPQKDSFFFHRKVKLWKNWITFFSQRKGLSFIFLSKWSKFIEYSKLKKFVLKWVSSLEWVIPKYIQ